MSVEFHSRPYSLSGDSFPEKEGIFVPDIWQQAAIRGLLAGKDVIVDAPTGAGKTFVFEKCVERSHVGRAVYTVPTRALANDKLLEWKAKGWNVGITTGDLSHNSGAPVVVATLETQRQSLLRGEGPDLLVIDEYQMLNDPLRGLNYELAIASAPAGTQLLLLSGSTANPNVVVDWLRRLGRDVELVSCLERPVPQEEVQLDRLRQKIPPEVIGVWPKRIARALKAGLGPILLFAPHRRMAEDIARKLTVALPPCEPLELTPEQSYLTRGPLRKMLIRRVAYHHSGMDYRQRAGVIEPLAKAGQLRVIVATSGLAAGINFSMRSVLVTESQYRFGEETRSIRPDELLQMFGRAGRRGIDPVGYVLTCPGKPRLRDGRPHRLLPNRRIDWQACLTTLQSATSAGDNPRKELSRLNERFLSAGKLNLGLGEDLPPVFTSSEAPSDSALGKNWQIEMQTVEGTWERLGKKRRVPLNAALFYHNHRWHPALEISEVLKPLRVGTLCRMPGSGTIRYGRLLTVANSAGNGDGSKLIFTKWFRKALSRFRRERKESAPPPAAHCTLDTLVDTYLPLLPQLTYGGQSVHWEEVRGMIRVYLDYGESVVFARLDARERGLINPPVRQTHVENIPDLNLALGNRADDKPRRPARNWVDLGLMDARFRPTRRGVIFSFFSQGEGLAVAAGLEDPSLAIGEMIFQLANLRAGHRFEEIPNSDSRLGDVSRMTYRWRTIPGYLKRGVPPEYGEGAAEVVAALVQDRRKTKDFESELVHTGDMERALLEWRSLLRQITHAPDFAWDRWIDLKNRARDYLDEVRPSLNLDELPALGAHQLHRPDLRN